MLLFRATVTSDDPPNDLVCLLTVPRVFCSLCKAEVSPYSLLFRISRQSSKKDAFI
jgi:hypothetical protein